ncbi:MAG: phage tail family protein [Mogibacterium sp.]|nr:phage tail family protein [Mogibacterium sp.]
MFTLIAQNKYGQRLELTHNQAYVVKSIEGIDPPEGVINTTRNADADGSVFNSAYVNNRQIIITLAINGPAEQNRINLYKYFKSKYPVRLFYKNESRDVYIDGYVKKPMIDFFAEKQIAQITIFCPSPFFKGATDIITDFSSVESAFEFPFEIEAADPIEFGIIIDEIEKNIIYHGDVETGAVITLDARGSVANPIIANLDTNQFFKLNLSMARGDRIIINTTKKQKSARLISNGVVSNVVGSIADGSTWLQILPDDNMLQITATSGSENLDAYVAVTEQFEGV